MKQAIEDIRNSLAPYYPKGEIEGFIRIIFENLMHYSPVDIVMHKDSILSDFMREKINNVVQRLIAGEPIQYIFNEASFYGHRFRVTPDTLIPRPETEELVDMIVKENSTSDLRVLDIGTGSGCIAISLALALRFAQVSAFDFSESAIDVAKTNAQSLKAKVNFKLVDILTAQPQPDQFDIIVSNPPYICDKEKESMDNNVLDHEPHSALFVPDNDPLLFYRTISDYALTALADKGLLYFEINSLYVDEMVALLQSKGMVDIVKIRDMYGRYRFIKAKKNAEK